MNDHTTDTPKHRTSLTQNYRPKRVPSIENINRRFWSKVDKSDVDGCWLWAGHQDSSTGYGTFRLGSTYAKRAHRVAYELANGPIQKGKLVCHTCDNRMCVRPDHLFLGTIQDNLRDMKDKNRQARGGMLGRSSLTETDIIEIRRLHRTTPKSTKELGRQFGVSRQTICDIVMGRTWNHVKEP